MSIVYTYDDLVESMQNFAEDDDTDFTSEIPRLIAKAETRILRELNLELFEDWLEITVSASNRLVTKPSDVIEINTIFVRDPSAQRWMEVPRRKFEYCQIFAPVETETGVPSYYSEYDETQVYIVPTPDKSYAGGNARARCTIRPTGLSTGNQNTWLGDNVGDILFQAVMVEVHQFLKNQPKVQEHAQAYMSLMPGVEREMQDGKRLRYQNLQEQATEGER